MVKRQKRAWSDPRLRLASRLHSGKPTEGLTQCGGKMPCDQTDVRVQPVAGRATIKRQPADLGTLIEDGCLDLVFLIATKDSIEVDPQTNAPTVQGAERVRV